MIASRYVPGPNASRSASAPWDYLTVIPNSESNRSYTVTWFFADGTVKSQAVTMPGEQILEFVAERRWSPVSADLMLPEGL